MRTQFLTTEPRKPMEEQTDIIWYIYHSGHGILLVVLTNYTSNVKLVLDQIVKMEMWVFCANPSKSCIDQIQVIDNWFMIFTLYIYNMHDWPRILNIMNNYECVTVCDTVKKPWFCTITTTFNTDIFNRTRFNVEIMILYTWP